MQFIHTNNNKIRLRSKFPYEIDSSVKTGRYEDWSVSGAALHATGATGAGGELTEEAEASGGVKPQPGRGRCLTSGNSRFSFDSVLSFQMQFN